MSSLPTALTGNVNTQIYVQGKSVDAYGNSPSSNAVVWSSSNNTVAIVSNVVDNNGIRTDNAFITCLTAGTATITATAGTSTAVFNLTVVNTVASSATDVEIFVDQNIQPNR